MEGIIVNHHPKLLFTETKVTSHGEEILDATIVMMKWYNGLNNNRYLTKSSVQITSMALLKTSTPPPPPPACRGILALHHKSNKRYKSIMPHLLYNRCKEYLLHKGTHTTTFYTLLTTIFTQIQTRGTTKNKLHLCPF